MTHLNGEIVFASMLIELLSITHEMTSLISSGSTPAVSADVERRIASKANKQQWSTNPALVLNQHRPWFSSRLLSEWHIQHDFCLDQWTWLPELITDTEASELFSRDIWVTWTRNSIYLKATRRRCFPRAITANIFSWFHFFPNLTVTRLFVGCSVFFLVLSLADSVTILSSCPRATWAELDASERRNDDDDDESGVKSFFFSRGETRESFFFLTRRIISLLQRNDWVAMLLFQLIKTNTCNISANLSWANTSTCFFLLSLVARRFSTIRLHDQQEGNNEERPTDVSFLH